MSVEKADLIDVLKRLSERHQREKEGKVIEEEVPLAGGNWPIDHIEHSNC